MPAFGSILRELRKEQELTQQQLADNIGLSFSTISMYERGEREPDFETLETIADFFNVSMDYLHGLTTNKGRGQFIVVCEECGLEYSARSEDDCQYHKRRHAKWLLAKERFPELIDIGEIEKTKSDAYDTIHSKNSSPDDIYYAWINMLKSYFSRSVKRSGFDSNHIGFSRYVPMLLYQNNLKNRIDSFTYSKLVSVFGTSPGIAEGEIDYDADYEGDNGSWAILPHLTPHESKVITAYRDKPEMQPAVDTLLGISEEAPAKTIKIAAYGGGVSEQSLNVTDREIKDALEKDEEDIFTLTSEKDDFL